eukprot:757938-Prorocentrum_minimum.AAC.1
MICWATYLQVLDLVLDILGFGLVLGNGGAQRSHGLLDALDALGANVRLVLVQAALRAAEPRARAGMGQRRKAFSGASTKRYSAAICTWRLLVYM